ncbi:MAG: glycosyltransferase family 4 protein [Verrucomicrobiae bacterium]|nr:glycosyltransferase family 4 protein [Verrucomicrobiae bacterium]
MKPGVALKIFLTGAHGGYLPLKAPMGGGATIFECMREVWADRPDVELEMLSPGPAYPALRQFVQQHPEIGALPPVQTHPASLGYREYASFSRVFERAVTECLLARHAEPSSWVVTHDISEGPQAERLRKHGYRVATVVHVDVVDFIHRLYLRGWVAPEVLASMWRFACRTGIATLAPDILKLVFEKQEQAYRHSNLVLVPSSFMRETIRRCYVGDPEPRVEVVEWGAPSLKPWAPPPEGSLDGWRKRWNIRDGDFVILSLCRISPEKGIERLLQALGVLERIEPGLAERCHAVIAGGAAYMDGPKCLRRLQRLAGRLRKARVSFTGHVTGEEKTCAFAAADLYALLSHHESFGLTLCEALAAGLPAVISAEVARTREPSPDLTVTSGRAHELAGILMEKIRKPRSKAAVAPPLFNLAGERILRLLA